MDMQAYKYRVDEPRCYICSAYEYTQDSPLREDFKGRSVCETCWSQMHTDPPADDPLARPLAPINFPATMGDLSALPNLAQAVKDAADALVLSMVCDCGATYATKDQPCLTPGYGHHFRAPEGGRVTSTHCEDCGRALPEGNTYATPLCTPCWSGR